MDKQSERILGQVRKMAWENLYPYPVNIYLFGSWARNAPTRGSDIDVAVDPERPLPPGILADLREKFEESPVPYRVDVVDLSQVRPEFRKAVIQKGIRWNDSENASVLPGKPSRASKKL
jgi:predicted nucleotidyltransferase